MATFNDLVESIGRLAAEKLVDEFGGTRIYVPVSAQSGDEIACAIGLEAASKLSRTFGGERFYMPLLARDSQRIEEIRRMSAAGASTADIARRLRCTERWVYRVIEGDRRPQR